MSLTYAFHKEYDLFDNQLDDQKFLHQGQADHDELLQVTHDLGHDVVYSERNRSPPINSVERMWKAPHRAWKNSCQV
ncbi:unnamed protein product [Sphagnum troendelagicum]|uniref:Transposase n=1 Tax=Sphagnum troendelagicum TaxID=128251 RepID=A0ABP0UUW5_9BRYO